MAKADKRAKRAKQKAKQARIAKQNQTSGKAQNDTLFFSDEIIRLFESMDGAMKDECFPALINFIAKSEHVHRDIHASTTILYVQYHHWLTSGSNGMDKQALISMTDLLLGDEEFNNKLDHALSVIN